VTLLGSALVALAAASATKIDGKPFNASLMDLARSGYVEEEFFISGTAKTYDIPRDQMSNGTPRTPRIPSRRASSSAARRRRQSSTAP
jgi:hypothetical protein